MIEPARERMKAGHPIYIDRARVKDPPGGAWQKLDPVSQGRVQILPAGRDPVSQARTAMAELLRLAALSPDWDWSRCAVIAREWEYLVSARAFCEIHGIPAHMGNEEIPGFWRLRETRAFIEWLRSRETGVVDGAALCGWANACTSNPWNELLRQAIDEHALETGGAETPVNHFIEWLAEWGQEIRRRQRPRTAKYPCDSSSIAAQRTRAAACFPSLAADRATAREIEGPPFSHRSTLESVYGAN